MTKHRLLYVDDEADIREIAAMSLELDPGFEVRVCDSGPAAISEAQAWRPDLILLDVMMPGMDGPETLTALRADPGTQLIDVVFVTARTQTFEVERFLSLGAIGVIPKPFDPVELAGQVRAFIERAGA